MRIKCTACDIASRRDRIYCHECNGVGHIDLPTNCKHENEEYEAMTGGWYCPDCGGSGPL